MKYQTLLVFSSMEFLGEIGLMRIIVYAVLIANKGKVEVYGPGVYVDEDEAAIFR